MLQNCEHTVLFFVGALTHQTHVRRLPELGTGVWLPCKDLCQCLQGKVPSDLADRSGNEEVMHLLVAACIECQMALRNPAADSTEPLPPGNSALELSLTQAFQSQVYLY